MVNTTFPVMDEVIPVQAMPEFIDEDFVKLIMQELISIAVP